jgi:hypothetical protein
MAQEVTLRARNQWITTLESDEIQLVLQTDVRIVVKISGETGGINKRLIVIRNFNRVNRFNNVTVGRLGVIAMGETLKPPLKKAR